MKPSERLTEKYEETSKEVVKSKTISSFESAIILQNSLMFKEIGKILDELHEEKKEGTTPSPCKATEEKKEWEIKDFGFRPLKMKNGVADGGDFKATDTKVESWEEEWQDLYENGGEEDARGVLTPKGIYEQRTNFIRRTRAEAISEHNREVKKEIAFKHRCVSEECLCKNEHKFCRKTNNETILKILSLPILNK